MITQHRVLTLTEQPFNMISKFSFKSFIEVDGRVDCRTKPRYPDTYRGGCSKQWGPPGDRGASGGRREVSFDDKTWFQGDFSCMGELGS